MKSHRLLHVLKVILIVIVATFVVGFVTQHLWNWLMPSIFGLRAITFAEAVGLFVFSKLLLGGFHRHGGGRHRGWKRHMEERWEGMSPEQRERFRAGMRGRRGCGFGHRHEPASEQTAQ